MIDDELIAAADGLHELLLDEITRTIGSRDLHSFGKAERARFDAVAAAVEAYEKLRWPIRDLLRLPKDEP